ncbi:hypothetical protein GDO78_016239 [Eleutherodactylus coqui]|uniref:Multidrug resistance-associated protein 1-like n=1 Tax=Eleutherodactylus coqui TaxID=57060 RepID=A0A8J6EAK0_ELECQ|nr:hypothetical protein GDO78_016239 [Eleutherodactylus coqui]
MLRTQHGSGAAYERLSEQAEGPERGASVCSRATYSWYSRIIKLGYRKPLVREDLVELNEDDSSYNVIPAFEENWRKESFKQGSKDPGSRKASLVRALWNTFKSSLIKVALMKVVADVLAFTSPQILKKMIAHSEDGSPGGSAGYLFALALFGVTILQTLILQLYQRLNMLTAVKIKTGVNGIIYKKSLNLANSTQRSFTTGELVNLMSSDAQQLMDLAVNLTLLWSAPFQILMAIVFLWQELGASVLAGVAVLILVIPLNAYIAARVKQLKVSIATFGVYFWMDESNILTASKVFTTISLFNILRLPLFDLPTVISSVVQVIIYHAVGFLAASFQWETNGPSILKDINIKIPEGSLVAVVGQVGSGKSSLLSAILGEMNKLEGTVQRKGSVAYVAQQAWLQNALFKENILFGRPLHNVFYEKVLEACALRPDLELLPHGDQTEIGERGVNLSGGQKQRVSLARAVYSDADLYLLDDPLSAVDVHVGKHLFEKVIGHSGLLKNKTRILVTHSLAVLPLVDLIVIMEDGRIGQTGTYRELVSERQDFAEMILASGAKTERFEGKSCLFVCYGAYVVTRGTICSSRLLHNQMLDNILHLPLQFFETTPMGQVLNRFTKDIYVIDERFHYYLRTWLNCMLDVLGTVLVIVFATPLFSLAIVPIGFLYLVIQRYYIASSRQIRRLDGASRSPVISHFSETLQGASTIRAFRHQERFIGQNKDVINENLVCYYNNVISNRWLAVRLEFLGNLVVFFAALFAVQAGNKMTSGTVGLSITYALNITQTLNFWVRKACEIETNGVAIERVCEYEEMEKEAPWILPRRPVAEWPDRGVIEFTNYQARYREDHDLALRDVTFKLHETEKLGIVGRTGAGKSTLTNCLFRIVERAGGRIVIDGIDISTIGLHDLRSKLNIIPQDPVLFSGTIRMNLDPLERHSDADHWEALEMCHLKNFVQSLPKKLNHEVSEGGGNLR